MHRQTCCHGYMLNFFLDTCLFVFLSFRLRPIDIKFMSLLHERVNIIPVIGKADTLTKNELSAMKKKVLS